MPDDDLLLLTGFDAFGGDVVNPSLDLVRALDGERLGGLRVCALTLPCAFATAPVVLAEAVERVRPRLVLALGQAAGRAELSLERVAINLIDARIADNAGARPIDVPVLTDAPPAYFSTLPIKAMVAAVRAAGVPVSVSHTAGTFVCNQVFFRLQHLLAVRAMDGAAPVPSGFMHVPLLPEQLDRHPGLPSLPLADMLRGLRAALVAAADAPSPDATISLAAAVSEGSLS